jgi:hypothetical protein
MDYTGGTAARTGLLLPDGVVASILIARANRSPLRDFYGTRWRDERGCYLQVDYSDAL